MNEKEQLIDELKELHKRQRAWHIRVHGEELDIELLKSMTVEELKKILEQVKGDE